MDRTSAKTVDAYVRQAPEDVRRRLFELRAAIRAGAPRAEESISYGMPTWKYLGKPLVYFAVYQHHVGFYPGAAAVREFAPELERFKTAKGSIQFPHRDVLPLKLVVRIVRFRVALLDERAAAKPKPRKRTPRSARSAPRAR